MTEDEMFQYAIKSWAEYPNPGLSIPIYVEKRDKRVAELYAEVVRTRRALAEYCKTLLEVT